MNIHNLFINKNDKYKYKFLLKDNNVDYFNIGNNNVKHLNNPFIKLIIILLLYIIIELEIYNYHELNEIEEKEDYYINDENKQKIEKRLITHDFFNITFLKNEMHYYSLYNIFKYPKISLVLLFQKNSYKDIFDITAQINNIIDKNFSNFEIILYCQNLKGNDYKYISKKYKKIINNKILSVYNKKDEIHNIYSKIIYSINGLYTIFINNLESLPNINIDFLFNYTKGKIQNFFNIPTNTSSYYLFKSKYLKDFIDKGIQFESLNQIIDKFKSLLEPNFNYIHISFCPDNYFTNLVYVSMISILSTKLINSYICFYLIVPPNFTSHNINFLKSLYDEYYHFNITFIKMDNRYDKSYTDSRITKQAYYRFSLGELLLQLNKVIYFDADIIVYKDLTNFYNTNFQGKVILGQPTYGNRNAQRLGGYRINTGVLLLNLLGMRKNKIEEKVIAIIKKGQILKYHDQTLLNDNFKEILGLFPPEFHTRPWSNYKEMNIFNKRIGKIYDKDYFYFSNKYPTIRHYLGRYKPKYPKINQIEDWWFYARKSKFFNNNAITYDKAFLY